MYSMKTITALTGLGPETLRAWERRYDTIVPRRDANGWRYYSQQDLERLTLLAKLTKQGHAISRLSQLTDDELQNLCQQTPVQPEILPQQSFVNELIDSLRHYQLDRCEQLLKRALVAHEPLSYVENILLPALHGVGELWHEGKLSIAQEHWFSGCVKRLVLSMVNNVHSLRQGQPAILFAAPGGEQHEFGLLAGCLLASTQQYNCYYLGANLPGADIAEAVHYLKPDIVVLSLVINPPLADTLVELSVMADRLRDVTVWLGGNGAMDLQQCGQLPEHWLLLNDIGHFYLRAQQWLQVWKNKQ